MPRVFISYSHDSREHTDRVLNLSNRLRAEGIDCEIDQYQESPVEGWPKWMDRQIANADFVLIICTEIYYRRVMGTEELGKGLGVRWESTLTYQHLYDAGADNKKFIPVLFDPKDSQFICTSLRGATYYILEQGYEDLYRRLTNQIKHLKPELGEIKPLAPKERKYDFFAPQISLAKLPTTQHALFGRDKELKRLDDAWANPHCHVLSFVAFGGVGKTAAVNEWLNRMELDNWRGAERIYGWSFYSQGTREDKQASADTFFEDALKFFGYTGEPLKSPWDKGKLLASLIRERKTLLILDGLEPLQYPPGVAEGRLRDQGLQALLKELARFNNGLCLITTRCKVTDIEHTLDKTTHQIDLDNLSPQTGMQVLREAGVTQGTDKELQGAAAEYDGHALALTLLGRYLAVRYDGEIRKRNIIKKLAYEKDRQGIHARHVMDSYELWLKGMAELDLLYIMGLFDRPAPLGAIEALKQPPVIKGLTDSLQRLSDEDWDFAIRHLRDLRLLSVKDEQRPDFLDCHPLIREHFSQKLKAKNEQAWKKAHGRLYEYYKNVPKKELPDTLEEMEPLFAAVAHGCQAGKYQETLKDIYWNRIRRKEAAYSVKMISAFGEDLSALSNFFDVAWEQLSSNLTKEDKADVLAWTAFRLRALGRLRESVRPAQTSIDIFAEQKDWKKAAIAASNLSEFYLTLGELKEAVYYARQSVNFADRSEDMSHQFSKRTTLADALHQTGEYLEAESIFIEAETLLQKSQLGYPQYLFSLWGFRFCDLLLSQGRYKDVLNRANIAMEWVKKASKDVLSEKLDKLSIGIAYLFLNFEEKTSELTQSINYIDQSIQGLRETGDQDFLAHALIIRSALHRIQNEFPYAWDDLQEAREIAERGSMNLWWVDYHLEAARVVSRQLAVSSQQSSVGGFKVIEDDKEVTLNKEEMIDRLKHHVEQAAELVKGTGYHRRDPEVELGYAGLFFAQGDQGKAREHLGKAKALLDKMGIRCWDFEVRRLEQVIGN